MTFLRFDSEGLFHYCHTVVSPVFRRSETFCGGIYPIFRVDAAAFFVVWQVFPKKAGRFFAECCAGGLGSMPYFFRSVQVHQIHGISAPILPTYFYITPRRCCPSQPSAGRFLFSPSCPFSFPPPHLPLILTPNTPRKLLPAGRKNRLPPGVDRPPKTRNQESEESP